MSQHFDEQPYGGDIHDGDIHSDDLSPVSADETRAALAAFGMDLAGDSPALGRLAADIEAHARDQRDQAVCDELFDLAIEQERQRHAAKFEGDVD